MSLKPNPIERKILVKVITIVMNYEDKEDTKC